jgi:hypothetical protein
MQESVSKGVRWASECEDGLLGNTQRQARKGYSGEGQTGREHQISGRNEGGRRSTLNQTHPFLRADGIETSALLLSPLSFLKLPLFVFLLQPLLRLIDQIFLNTTTAHALAWCSL